MLTTENGKATADPEVLEKAKRRRFTAAKKLQFLREYEATPKGERGAYLRRHGLYSSHIDTWRRQATSGELNALEPKQRGRKRKPGPNPEVVRLRKQVARLQQKLVQAGKVIEVQKNDPAGAERRPPVERETRDAVCLEMSGRERSHTFWCARSP